MEKKTLNSKKYILHHSCLNEAVSSMLRALADNDSGDHQGKDWRPYGGATWQ